MSVREYIGARYIPLFANPIQWDNTNAYEPLTVVMNQGTSYVSRQSVPAGIALDNTNYWVHWADYNAQIEAYRQEVQTYSASISALNDALPIENFDDDNTVKDAIDGIEALLPATAFDSTNTVDARFDNLGALLPATAFDSTNTVDARFDTIEADNWVTTNRINDGAVTSAKIADGTILFSDFKDVTVNKITRNKIGVIGDSFTDPAHDLNLTVWPKILGDATNYTIVNKAKGGAGFTTGTTKFIDQLNNLIANYDMSEFAYILVYGGVNDWNDANASVADMVTAIDTFCNTYRTITGIRPKLVLAFGSIGKENRAAYDGFMIWYNLIMTTMKRNPNGQFLVDHVPFWLMAKDGVRKSDNLHLTQRGYHEVANYFYQIINGSYDGNHTILRGKTQQVAYTGGNNDLGYYEIHFDNGIVTWRVLNTNNMRQGYGNDSTEVYVNISNSVLTDGTLQIGTTDMILYSPEIITTTTFASPTDNSLVYYKIGLNLQVMKFYLICVINNNLNHTDHTFSSSWTTYPKDAFNQLCISGPCWGY